LPVDAAEVHVTRRVYRSGEGEYLINQQAVRLKDVKALIRGTGIGIDAYSLIEQGKVDRMLQANAKDRRAIFEEAAGISRFKAKKVEAERRLGRVQQNLTRLGDIVDEVATRLKTLKSQAGKAERYRQASERLKELRTVVAWNDWNRLAEEVAAAEAELVAAGEQQSEAEAERDRLEEQRQAAEAESQSIAQTARAAEQQKSELAGKAARLKGLRESDQTTRSETRRVLAGHYRRLRAMRHEAGSAAADLQQSIDQLESAREACRQAVERKDAINAQRDALQQQVAEVESRRDELQREHLAIVRRVAEHEAARQRVVAQAQTAAQDREQTAASLRQAEQEWQSARQQRDEAEAEVGRLVQQIEDAGREVELVDARVAETRRLVERRRDEIGSLKIRLQGLTERARVLDELQQRQEGVHSGVREVLRIGDPELRDELIGIVADCLTVEPQVAPLIDAALGLRSQYVIARGGRISEAIVEGRLKVPSRVGFLRIDELPNRRPGDRIRLDGLHGVIGRADRMVDCDEELRPLCRHLLGNTWLVDKLATAMGLRKLAGAGLRFVTANGELIDNDGSSVVGPPGGETGLVSRRSELASAHKEIEHYRFQVSEAEQELTRQEDQLDQHSAELGRAEQIRRDAITRHAAAEAKAQHAIDREQTRGERVRSLTESIDEHEASLARAEKESERLGSAISQGRESIRDLETQRGEVDQTLGEASAGLRQRHAEAMSASVEAARLEQRVESLATAVELVRKDQTQREAARKEVQDSIERTRQRIDEIEHRMQQTEEQLADLADQMKSAEGELERLAQAAEASRQQTREIQTTSQAAVGRAAKARETLVSITAKRDAATHKQSTLAERIAEDYQIDLHHDSPPEELQAIEDREAIEQEISTLRSQVQNVGSVNMEALEELNELQVRYDELHGQYQDLTAAKDSLQRVIARINADSRRLFLDTLEAIRLNFQTLYRKSFGGGHADLVLEESDDPLEAGVEIVATPPGKPSFSNSLLSGGEKALTAVALLMSIFQYRPSPFCVLDEVDAPFDEANIGRFVTVLTQFLDQSKFVVVTHSKKTMTAATTLYGVTMQESGVSKQVSIRFEDVSEDGQINAA